ncbi:MAG: HipA domain-containing protein [Rhizobium sp.]|uniref:type II toxin-antitoxin system HipA family toxin n=1 Tax=Rhizobium sp. TaxID=391 RepID=UPI0006473DBB
MTISKHHPSECFVYITLPGETKAVTAGRFSVTQDRRGTNVGHFVYGRSYRENRDAVEIDPVELKVAARNYETAAMGGIFGSLRDAGPDHWGRRLIERHVGKAPLNELDYLLNSPDDRAGALGFGLNVKPPAPSRDFNKTLDLARLQEVADTIVRDEDVDQKVEREQIEEILLLGTSMGGARPKAVVEDGSGLWLAKFNRNDDRWNQARVEHAMLLLGRECGLVTADSCITTVANRDVLLVKRFDREKVRGGYHRARMVSGLTLLKAEDSHRSRDTWSYVLLVEELRRVCEEPRSQAHELFRRMCFNALISNTDDHPRNHAAIAKSKDWKLSPAYDLTPSTPISIEQLDLALICGDQGRIARASNFLSQCHRFLLSREEAVTIIKDMANTVRSAWYDVARSAGVTESDCKTIEGAFAYPGFGDDQI